jgi:DNA-binding SARP family transcriptional activator
LHRLAIAAGQWVEHEVLTKLVRQGAYDDALELYQGRLFPKDPYADWAVWDRERLAQRYLQALLGAAENALADNRPDDALMLARKALKLEPWQEQATRVGMEACLAMGDRAGALRLYRKLAQRLQEDLSIEPGEALRAFYGQVAAAGRS